MRARFDARLMRVHMRSSGGGKKKKAPDNIVDAAN